LARAFIGTPISPARSLDSEAAGSVAATGGVALHGPTAGGPGLRTSPEGAPQGRHHLRLAQGRRQVP
jgi:hypothetical protein